MTRHRSPPGQAGSPSPDGRRPDPEAAPKTPPASRAERTAARRGAIIDAALTEFTERGYAAARIEDVAARAGVAKGTIYLHFPDKAALFAGIVRERLAVSVGAVAAEPPHEGESAKAFLERLFIPLLLDLAASRRADVIRLLIAEGGRFPELADTYFREVVQTGVTTLRGLGARARAAGEPGWEILERYPHLVVAPALLAVVWSMLFGRIQALDGAALIRAQLDLILPDPHPRDQSVSVPRRSIPKPETPT